MRVLIITPLEFFAKPEEGYREPVEIFPQNIPYIKLTRVEKSSKEIELSDIINNGEDEVVVRSVYRTIRVLVQIIKFPIEAREIIRNIRLYTKNDSYKSICRNLIIRVLTIVFL